jgi:hypothetical protein
MIDVGNSLAKASEAMKYLTTDETENGLLLIELFKKLLNPHDYGHLETGGLSYMSGSVRISQVSQFHTLQTM